MPVVRIFGLFLVRSGFDIAGKTDLMSILRQVMLK